MKRMFLGLTTSALALAMMPSPAQADPETMTHAEWLTITEGQSVSKVESECSCLGSWGLGEYAPDGTWLDQMVFQTPNSPQVKAIIDFKTPRGGGNSGVTYYRKKWGSTWVRY